MVLPLWSWQRSCGRIAEQDFGILNLQCAATLDKRVWPPVGLVVAGHAFRQFTGGPQPRWTDSPRPPTARLQGMPASWTISGSIIIGTSCAGGPGGIGAGMHKQGFNYICLPASIDARLHVGQLCGVLGASYDGPSEKPIATWSLGQTPSRVIFTLRAARADLAVLGVNPCCRAMRLTSAGAGRRAGTRRPALTLAVRLPVPAAGSCRCRVRPNAGVLSACHPAGPKALNLFWSNICGAA